MFEINGNDLYISRGEPVVLEITPEENGEVYILDPLECLELRVFNNNDGVNSKKIRTLFGTTEFHIASNFTQNLYGTYYYSVRLIFADGSHKTIIGETPTQRPRFYVLEG